MKKYLRVNLLLSLFFLFSIASIYAVNPGDILITEYMADPAQVSDAAGEYIELYNNTAGAIDINGWTLKDNGASHVISTTNGTLEIPAYGFLVLGKGDGSYNNRDYEYSDLTLNNTGGDEIVLETSGTIEICKTAYTNELTTGAALELNNISNNIAGVTLVSNYVLATDALGSDYGSPGAAGNTKGTDQLPPAGVWNLTEGETDIALDFTIEITFDDSISNTNATEITDINVDDLIIFKETDENGSNVDFDASIDINKKIVSISSVSDLSYSQLYFLVIGPVADSVGNITDGDTLTFTTTDPPSDDATLSDLLVDGKTITDFTPETTEYEFELDEGTTVAPTVTATKNHADADAVIDPAADVTSDTEADRTTTITVTAEDGVAEEVYTIVFNVDSSTGIADLSARYKIYPNPGTGLFKLEMNNISNGEYTIKVYDVIGKLIYKSQITENISNIDLTNMNSGLYFISVNKGEERNITKIMIQ